MAKTAQQEGFSLDRFLDLGVKRRRSRELTALVQRDGRYVFIDPMPCTPGPMLRVEETFVEIGDTIIVTCGDGSEKEAHRVRIDLDAPCVRLEAGTAREFLDPAIPFGLLDVRVQDVKITFNADASGTLAYGGTTIPCLGKKDYAYKLDVTNQGKEGTDKFKEKYSNEFQAWMYWAVLIDGERGVYIHEGATTGSSAGCIHVATPQAEAFYKWVDKPTRIVISVPW